MNIRQKALTTALGAMLVSGSALAEQTIGIQAPTTPSTAAVATAHVNVRVIVQKIVVLQIGSADANKSDVNFKVDLNTSLGTGNSLAYTGTVPPTLGTTVATTNPTTSAGALSVAAWTNITGTKLTCTLGALTGATAFASGATAGGVPGTADIAVDSVSGAGNLQHPGTDLTGCNGTVFSSIPTRTTMGGTFTYRTTFTESSLEAGTYGNVVTYTATTL